MRTADIFLRHPREFRTVMTPSYSQVTVKVKKTLEYDAKTFFDPARKDWFVIDFFVAVGAESRVSSLKRYEY